MITRRRFMGAIAGALLSVSLPLQELLSPLSDTGNPKVFLQTLYTTTVEKWNKNGDLSASLLTQLLEKEHRGHHRPA